MECSPEVKRIGKEGNMLGLQRNLSFLALRASLPCLVHPALLEKPKAPSVCMTLFRHKRSPSVSRTAVILLGCTGKNYHFGSAFLVFAGKQHQKQHNQLSISYKYNIIMAQKAYLHSVSLVDKSTLKYLSEHKKKYLSLSENVASRQCFTVNSQTFSNVLTL